MTSKTPCCRKWDALVRAGRQMSTASAPPFRRVRGTGWHAGKAETGMAQCIVWPIECVERLFLLLPTQQAEVKAFNSLHSEAEAALSPSRIVILAEDASSLFASAALHLAQLVSEAGLDCGF